MSAPSRLAAFAAILAVVFGGAALAGAAIDPTDEKPAAGHGRDGGDHAQRSGEHAPAGTSLSGLAVSQGGFTLEPEQTSFAAGARQRLRFRILDRRGQAVRDGFELEAERELHLVVVRRDTAIYEHVHPRRARDGTWSVDLRLREPGVYRAFADFQIGGEKRVLATDLFVPGDFRPDAWPQPEPVSEVDGFSVRLASDRPLRAGRPRTLSFSVARRGQPFGALERYLGARGHLVALREGDLGYLHVHPEDGTGAVAFEATFPTAGRYRLFFQFQAAGRVRTVAYTVDVPR